MTQENEETLTLDDSVEAFADSLIDGKPTIVSAFVLLDAQAHYDFNIWTSKLKELHPMVWDNFHALMLAKGHPHGLKPV